MSFSKELKKVMEELQLTQKDLSQLTGIGKSSISQYLSGRSVPSQKRIDGIAEALEIPVEFLTGELSEAEDIESLRNVPVALAAKLVGKSEQFIRVGLQSRRLPFGTAVKMSSKFTYHISPKLLKEYVGE